MRIRQPFIIVFQSLQILQREGSKSSLAEIDLFDNPIGATFDMISLWI
jgi:hypothetical protein